jgi:hypothetical protein
MKQRFRDEGYQLFDVLPLNLEDIKEQFIVRLGPDGVGVFDKLGPSFRHLLSNPQHLGYALEWQIDHMHQGQDNTPLGRTRGSLLDHCIGKTLTALPHADRLPVIRSVLRRLGYQVNNGSVYIPIGDLRQTTAETLLVSHSSVTADDLIRDLREADLMLPSRDESRFRFPHHSHQQYFAACEMKERWTREAGSYIHSVLWHEPLVIMAGLLDGRQLAALLRQIQTNNQLYAYVLANVDLPDKLREFQLHLAKAFCTKVRFSAQGLAWLLGSLFGAWFLSLPVVAYLLNYYFHEVSLLGLLVHLLALGYVLVLPKQMRSAYQTWVNSQMNRLGKQDLPQMVNCLRYLDAKGSLAQVHNELVALQRRLAYRAEDPRMVFLGYAIGQVAQAAQAPSFMTEDEMLKNIDDPLVVVAIAIESVSASFIEQMIALAREQADRPATGFVLAKLQELYGKNPEYRDELRDLFVDLAMDPRLSRRRHKHARAVCRSLNIPVSKNHALRPSLMELLGRFFKRVLRITDSDPK